MINLETSVTASDDHWRSKEIHYRMHPDNIPSLTAAGIDICSLANNHVLDWGYPGLIETLDTLKKTNIRSAGAGRNLKEARAPSILDVKGKGRVIAFSYGAGSSGIPPDWAAKENTPGVNRLDTLSDETARLLKKKIQNIKKHGDIVIVSIHWGSNWGYDIQDEQREFAHKLIEEFMVLANVAAAEALIARKSALLFRVHEEPAPEKLETLQRREMNLLELDSTARARAWRPIERHAAAGTACVTRVRRTW